MRLLLDTHTVLWTMPGAPEITRRAYLAVKNPDNEAYVSVVSVWEAATKFRIGKPPKLLHWSATQRQLLPRWA
jgi:PIN domain nuclease of toxin-antitoxin system